MMAKRTLWQWLFGLMDQPAPEPRQPMAVPNTPARGKPMAGAVSLTEDEWNEECNSRPVCNFSNEEMLAAASEVARRRAAYWQQVIGMQGKSTSSRGEAVYQWHPGIEHTQPHPVKENPDGTLYYKGKVYRMIGDHGRRNSNSKRRQAKGAYE